MSTIPRRATPAGYPQLRTCTTSHRHGARPEDVLPSLAARFDAELAEREAIRAALSGAKQRPRWAILRRLAPKLDTAGSAEVPIERHLSTNALNAAILAFALPVGVALFILAALGRESLSLTARTMALTGTAMGTSQTETGQALLSFFM